MQPLVRRRLSTIGDWIKVHSRCYDRIAVDVRRKAKEDYLAGSASFVDGNLAFVLSRAQGLKRHDWNPTSLGSSGLEFRSALVAGGKQGPSPCLYLWLNSGDGYYTIQVTATSRKTLDDAVYDKYFTSLTLE